MFEFEPEPIEVTAGITDVVRSRIRDIATSLAISRGMACAECGDPFRQRMKPGSLCAACQIGSVDGWDEERTGSVIVEADSDCTCWEGYERVPGTKPCASGSCRKKSSLEKEGIAEILMPLLENSVRNGPYNKEYNKFWGPGGGGESWTVTMFDKHIGPLLDKIDERRKKKKEKETAETAVTTDE